MEIIITFILSFAFGWVMRELHAQRQMSKVLKNVETAVKQELREKVTRIIIEKQKDTYYVYNADDLTFMAQGNSRKELEDNLAKRYPGKFFGANPDNLKNVGFDQ